VSVGTLFLGGFIPGVLMGSHLAHFGLILVLNLMIGVATPPAGLSLFVASEAQDIRLERPMRECIAADLPLPGSLTSPRASDRVADRGTPDRGGERRGRASGAGWAVSVRWRAGASTSPQGVCRNGHLLPPALPGQPAQLRVLGRRGAIRPLHKETSRIILTALADPELDVNGFRAGATLALRKPFRAQTLVSTIQTTLALTASRKRR